MTNIEQRRAFESWVCARFPELDASNNADQFEEALFEAWSAALSRASAAPAEPDMRHPKIQALIGAKARREIELQLVEQLLDEGPDCDVSAMGMEYWHGLHNKLRDKLRAATPVAELVDALREITDDYADRFDMDSPSTNPGMKYVVKQARAALARYEGAQGGGECGGNAADKPTTEARSAVVGRP